MGYIFISYKNEEFNEALVVKTALENNGIDCWMAPMSIGAGSSYAAEIPSAIRNCDAFLLILSEKAQESKWIPRELDQAINNNKLILPYLIENCDLNDEFAFYLANVQYYDATNNKETVLSRVVDDIKKLLNVDTFEVTEIENSIVDEEKSFPSLEEAEDDDSKKQKKSKKKSLKSTKNNPPKKHKKALIIAGCVILTIVVLVSSIGIYNANNTFWIGTNRYKKSDVYVSLEGVSVTDDDVLNMEKMDDIDTISFKKCNLKGIDLNRILKLVSNGVVFDECSINNGDIANLNVKNTEITEIIFDNNPELTDLSVLKTYASSLTSLSFDNCSVNDLSFLKDLTKLTSLYADKNDISDISNLKYCKNITDLRLSNNKISSLESIRELAKITKLNVSNNQISSLAPLEKLIYLEDFNASNNKLKDISGLSNVTQLISVNLSDNEIVDVSILCKSSLKLNKIYISNNKITDISSLAVCNFVKVFIAHNNALTDISAIKNWSELSKIDVSFNQIGDISPLSECLKLDYVDLSDNKILSVDCLDFTQNKDYISYVDVSNNLITAINLAPFNFYTLKIYGNEIQDLSFLNKFTDIGTLVFDYNDKINFEALKQLPCYDFYVLNCPLDKQVYVSTTLGTDSVKFTLDDSQ